MDYEVCNSEWYAKQFFLLCVSIRYFFLNSFKWLLSQSQAVSSYARGHHYSAEYSERTLCRSLEFFLRWSPEFCPCVAFFSRSSKFSPCWPPWMLKSMSSSLWICQTHLGFRIPVLCSETLLRAVSLKNISALFFVSHLSQNTLCFMTPSFWKIAVLYTFSHVFFASCSSSYYTIFAGSFPYLLKVKIILTIVSDLLFDWQWIELVIEASRIITDLIQVK